MIAVYYATDYEMRCSLNLRLDLGSFFGQFVQKSLFLQKNKEKTGPTVHAFSVKIWQPIKTDCIYANDHEMKPRSASG